MRCAVCHNPEPHRVRENQLIEDIGGPPFWSDTREFDPETDWPVLSEEVGRFSAESAWYPQGDDSAANELIFTDNFNQRTLLFFYPDFFIFRQCSY